MTKSPAVAALALPDAQHRLRCGACGNLTRFDVVRRATIGEYWHQDLSGEVAIEEAETTEQTVVSITCRWCTRADAIEIVPRPGTGDA